MPPWIVRHYRAYLDKRMVHEINQASLTGARMALLFIDLDNFKKVNDLHGHKSGDQLLVDVASILRTSLRQSDTLARWGGDEFIVLLPELHEVECGRKVAAGLMSKLQKNLEEKYIDASVTLSIGIANYPDDADSSEALLIQADKALLHAKSQGRNNIQLFSEIQGD